MRYNLKKNMYSSTCVKSMIILRHRSIPMIMWYWTGWETLIVTLIIVRRMATFDHRTILAKRAYVKQGSGSAHPQKSTTPGIFTDKKVFTQILSEWLGNLVEYLFFFVAITGDVSINPSFRIWGYMCCMLSTFHVSSRIVANVSESSFLFSQ